MFSIVIFEDGIVEVAFNGKVRRLKPKNPVLLLMPLMSALALAMGSQFILEREIKKLKKFTQNLPDMESCK